MIYRVLGVGTFWKLFQTVRFSCKSTAYVRRCWPCKNHQCATISHAEQTIDPGASSVLKYEQLCSRSGLMPLKS